VSRDQGPGLPPALLGMMAAAAHAAGVRAGEEGPPPPRMLEAKIYAPGSKPDDKPIAVLEESQIAGHDPGAVGIVEVLDAETGKQRIWIGFPYTVVEEPAPQSRVHVTPGVGRIVGG
jgi:hypothetical protein